MRIGSYIPSLPLPASDRGNTAARPPQPADDAPQDGASRGQGAVTRVRSRAAPAPNLQSLSDQQLSYRSRGALQTYLANSPSLTERLGVDLAGIDVQV